MREERTHLFGHARIPAGPLRREPSGPSRLHKIVHDINPSGNTVNCGHTIDAVIHRLNGTNPSAVSHNIGLGGSFEQIAARHGTAFTWQSSIEGIFAMLKSGGHGTIAMIGIKYSGGGAHIVTVGNIDGVVGICEGQDWAPGQPPEVVAHPHRANARYNASGANDLGLAVIRWGCPLRSAWEGAHTDPRAAQPRSRRYSI